MAMLNKVLLIGRLTRDPELRYTPGGLAIAEFGFAVNRRRKQGDEWVEDVAFVDITTFGRTADNVQKFLGKGRQAFIEGHLVFDQWAKDGVKRSKLKVVADNVQFLDSPGRDQSQGQSQGQPPAQQQYPSAYPEYDNVPQQLAESVTGDNGNPPF